MEGLGFNSGRVNPDGTVAFGDDSRMHVEFFALPVQNMAASVEAGSPIYDNIDYIKIKQPGEHDEYHYKATEEFQHRFRAKWDAYKAQKDQHGTGTPLSLLFVTEPGMTKRLAHFSIFNVEQLAALSEAGIGRLGMGGRAQVQRAKDYLEMASRGVPSAALQTKLESQDAEIEALKGQIASLVSAQKEHEDGKRK